MNDPIRAISTDGAPGAIGPYSQAVAAGGLLYCSGQIGLDPVSMTLVEGGVGAQAERVMTNLAALLEAGGSSFDRVLKVTIYLAAMDDFAAVNDVYGRYFSGVKPARACIAAHGLPKGALVEIDCVARIA